MNPHCIREWSRRGIEILLAECPPLHVYRTITQTVTYTIEARPLVMDQFFYASFLIALDEPSFSIIRDCWRYPA